MAFDLFSTLVIPNTSQRLEWHKTERKFYHKGKNISTEFIVKDSIPIMLPETDAQSNLTSGSVFNYIEHYQKDSVAFNYFEAYEDPATNHENRRLHEAILQEVPNMAYSVLDVGCGSGWVAKSLLKTGKNIVSFDVAFNNVSKAITTHSSPNHFGVVGDVLALPFADASFDCIISAEVIEHVLDTSKYLQNIVRVLKPGGKAIISTPYKEKIPFSLCIHCNNMTPHNAHLWSFDEKSLDHLTKHEDGTQIEKVILSNKGLLYLRTHKFLKYAPYKLWRLVDKVANAVLNKPSRIIYIVTKPDKTSAQA